MAPNRLVVLLTPLVAGLLVRFIPDPEVAFTVAGALVLGVLSWLQGWKQFERFEQELELILAGHVDLEDGAELPGPVSGAPEVMPTPLPPVELLSPVARAELDAAGVTPSGQL